jgi:enoyl-CoA hydratase/carnithine racemase
MFVQSECWILIIFFVTGTTFCSGLDVRELKMASNEQNMRIVLGAVTELVETFRRIPLIIITQVLTSSHAFFIFQI